MSSSPGCPAATETRSRVSWLRLPNSAPSELLSQSSLEFIDTKEGGLAATLFAFDKTLNSTYFFTLLSAELTCRLLLTSVMPVTR
jgi:hypothetical protein